MAENKEEYEGKELVLKYWNERLTKMGPKVLGEDVRLCRARKPRAKEAKGKAKVQVHFALDNRVANLEPVIVALFIKQGGERKYGAAPRGHLEREAKKLLDMLG